MQHNSETGNTMIEALKEHYHQFHKSLPNRSVASQVLDLPEQPLSEHGCDLLRLDEDIVETITPHFSGSNGGRYLGFVTGGANPIATYADWLVSLYDQNVSKGGDSIATAVEYQALKWLKTLFTLPGSFDGLFTTGATAANFLAALTARQHLGELQGINVAENGIGALKHSIFSACPHASMVKSLGMAGFGQKKWFQVNSHGGKESMDVTHLEELLSVQEGGQSIVIASAGTVTGTDFDDLNAIAELCKRYGAWLHVDAAFGIFERLVNGPQGKTNGIEKADSITLDCHKWLNVPYDCGVFLTRHKKHLQASCDVAAPYLVGDDQFTPFMSLGVENSRRFRAFPVWATLKAYGKLGVTKAIEGNLAQAGQLADWLEANEYFQLVKPCELNVVLFKPDSVKLGKSTQECMQWLNNQGEVFFSPGQWQGEPIMRAAFSNWTTTELDVKRVIDALQELVTITQNPMGTM